MQIISEMVKLEPEALKYLKSRWSRFTEQGMADDILKALEKECGGLADDAVMGLDDVKAIVEKAGIEAGSKTIDDLINGLKETTNGNGIARNFEASGGYERTLKDFEALNPTDVKDI